MGLLVVGSVAFDTVKTPFGEVEEALGGSATYFSASASFFTDVSLVAVVGEDFPQEHLDFLKSRKINLDGLEKAPGRTFRWKGEYSYQLNEAKTLDTQLNVFQSFKPRLPKHYRNHEVVFLANIDPELQREVLQQVTKPKIVACDTMNFWIQSKKESLLKTLELVDIFIINEGEARMITGEPNLVKAASQVRKMGPKTLIVKRGEYGVLLFNDEGIFSVPAYPLESVFDPTGAGDTFAGGFMGYLAKSMKFDNAHIRKAIVFGSVMASFNVEDFSLNRLKKLTYKEVEHRYREFRKLTHFEDI
jgi:sugar/nucleoside kinase (ribokinase family)